jgi:hypothetical protein
MWTVFYLKWPRDGWAAFGVCGYQDCCEVFGTAEQVLLLGLTYAEAAGL